MTDHPHVATPYELKAAKRGLSAIVLPLLPEPEFDPKTKEWKWRYGLDAYAYFADRFPLHLIGLSAFTRNLCKGDRIYFQEPWSDDMLIADRFNDWEPAETMPSDLAEYWFTIAGVRVVQIKSISNQELFFCGLTDVDPELSLGMSMAELEFGKSSMEVANFVRQVGCEQNWDRAYCKWRYKDNPWVIELDVERIAP